MIKNISIGIPVYNEEKNIKKLLFLLENQNGGNFRITEIIIAADGCTDKSIDIIREFKSPKLKLIVSSKKRGQNYWLNCFFQMYKGDLLVIFDADTFPVDKDCLLNLVSPFIKEKTVGMVHGTSIPSPIYHGSFFESMLYFTIYLKEDMLQFIDEGQNIYVSGACRAISRNLTDKILIPDDVSEDSYMYLFAKEKKLKIIYNSKAKVYYNIPRSLKEYYYKTKKYKNGSASLYRYFSSSLISSNFELPKKWLLSYFIFGILKSPIYFISYIFVIMLSRINIFYGSKINNIFNINIQSKNIRTHILYENKKYIG